MRWFIGTVCGGLLVLGLVSGFFYVYGTRELRSNFGGQNQPVTLNGAHGWLAVPANKAKGAERVEQWQKVAYETCAAQSVEPLARQLETKATAEAVARGYARYAHEPAVYDACLRGFRA